jgi:hypothetical protein
MRLSTAVTKPKCRLSQAAPRPTTPVPGEPDFRPDDLPGVTGRLVRTSVRTKTPHSPIAGGQFRSVVVDPDLAKFAPQRSPPAVVDNPLPRTTDQRIDGSITSMTVGPGVARARPSCDELIGGRGPGGVDTEALGDGGEVHVGAGQVEHLLGIRAAFVHRIPDMDGWHCGGRFTVGTGPSWSRTVPIAGCPGAYPETPGPRLSRLLAASAPARNFESAVTRVIHRVVSAGPADQFAGSRVGLWACAQASICEPRPGVRWCLARLRSGARRGTLFRRSQRATTLFCYDVAMAGTADPRMTPPEYGGLRRYSVVRSPLRSSQWAKESASYGGRRGPDAPLHGSRAGIGRSDDADRDDFSARRSLLRC